MRKIVNFYYDYFSPYSYLALTQLPRLLDRCAADVEYAPIHVLTLMGIVGNRPTTIECKAKGIYVRADLLLWMRSYGVPFAANPSMRNIDGQRLLDGAAAAAALGEIEAYNRAVFGAMRAKPIADEVQFSQILKDGGVGQVEAILAGLAAGRATVDANIEDAAKVGCSGRQVSSWTAQ